MWQNSGLCHPLPPGEGHGGRWGWEEEGETGGGDMAGFGSSICSRVSNPNARNKSSEGARPEQPAASPSRGTVTCRAGSQQVPGVDSANPPALWGSLLRFPLSKEKLQGGKGARPGHTAGERHVDNTEQGLGGRSRAMGRGGDCG